MGEVVQRMRFSHDVVAAIHPEAFAITEPERDIDLAMIRHFAGLLPTGAKVLDAGCGIGRMLPVLRDLGLRPLGVDFSMAMIDRARREHPEFVTWAAPLTRIPCVNESFAAVFSWYSLTCIDDEQLSIVLEEFHRLLVPGGLLLISFRIGGTPPDTTAGTRHNPATPVDPMGPPLTRERIFQGAARQDFILVADLERAPVANEQQPRAAMIFRRAN
ncbi:hypothetical protein HMPREF1531_00495 [Propionibacterium sp. oral taxon 192 str. F0372]|uniref:class I SAM-dependent methyltransferase n=1 Tax=Propionibacterium sp. oral taxon 192 TaxID=671222 RepID=UPI000353D11A|nr:class I SAM-dependent methyltransferase [Propionibacterium sp. oral taxon 192]EPH06594.1 hypothetical protein HMPREF1531_00495 [Propionibacterium sp. oral taxon 192 str. F0372]